MGGYFFGKINLPGVFRNNHCFHNVRRTIKRELQLDLTLITMFLH